MYFSVRMLLQGLITDTYKENPKRRTEHLNAPCLIPCPRKENVHCIVQPKSANFIVKKIGNTKYQRNNKSQA